MEFSSKAEPLVSFEHPKRAIYVFGPEDGSLAIPDNARVVYIPTTGSMNVTASVAVLLYDRLVKLVN